MKTPRERFYEVCAYGSDNETSGRKRIGRMVVKAKGRYLSTSIRQMKRAPRKLKPNKQGLAEILIRIFNGIESGGRVYEADLQELYRALKERGIE